VPPRQRLRARLLGAGAGARRDQGRRSRSRDRIDDQAPRAGRHDEPGPALWRHGHRCAGAVSALADALRARAGRRVLPRAVALVPSGFSLFLVAALVVAIVPGPGIFYVAARTLSDGRKIGFASTPG